MCGWAYSASLPGVLSYFGLLATPGLCALARDCLSVSGVWIVIFWASEVRPTVLRLPELGGALGGRLAWSVLLEVMGGYLQAAGVFLWGLVAPFFLF